MFFINPTTYLNNAVWNGSWDAPDDQARLNPAVRLNQISAFNAAGDRAPPSTLLDADDAASSRQRLADLAL